MSRYHAPGQAEYPVDASLPVAGKSTLVGATYRATLGPFLRGDALMGAGLGALDVSRSALKRGPGISLSPR